MVPMSLLSVLEQNGLDEGNKGIVLYCRLLQKECGKLNKGLSLGAS